MPPENLLGGFSSIETLTNNTTETYIVDARWLAYNRTASHSLTDLDGEQNLAASGTPKVLFTPLIETTKALKENRAPYLYTSNKPPDQSR